MSKWMLQCKTFFSHEVLFPAMDSGLFFLSSYINNPILSLSLKTKSIMENEKKKDEKYLTCHFNGGDLKEILPVLKKHFSFTLFEIQGMLEWCNNNIYNREGTEIITDENGIRHSHFTPEEFFIEGNKPVYLAYPESLFNKIVSFFNDETNLITDDKQNTILCLMFYVYSESSIEPNYWEECGDYNYRIFHEFIRPDLLALYKFLHKSHPNFLIDQQAYKKHPNYRSESSWNDPYKSVTIVHGKHSITLNNSNNWLLTHLTEYISQYLKEDTIEEVESEMLEYKNKVGAKSDHDFHRIVTQLYHFLQEETPYHSPENKITDKICVFITKFLEALGFLSIVPEEEEFNIKPEDKKKSKTLHDWINNMRSNIQYNLKREREKGAYKSKKQESLEKASIKFESSEEGKPLMEQWYPKYW